MSKIFEKRRVVRCNRAIDLQTLVGPVADPVAIMQIGMTGIAVSDERLMVTSAGADRPSPACVAGVFGADMSAIKKGCLFRPIDSLGDVSQSVLVRIHETMTRRYVARRTDAY